MLLIDMFEQSPQKQGKYHRNSHHLEINQYKCLLKSNQVEGRTRPRGFKTFFMLNSIEHEISTAHKN